MKKTTNHGSKVSSVAKSGGGKGHGQAVSSVAKSKSNSAPRKSATTDRAKRGKKLMKKSMKNRGY